MWPTEKPPAVTVIDRQRLDALADFWVEQNRSSTPSDHPLAERSIRAIYAEAGLPGPSVCWTRDPLAAVLAARRHNPTGSSIKDLLLGRLQGRVETDIDQLSLRVVRNHFLLRLGTPGVRMGRDMIVPWSLITHGNQLLPAGLTVSIVDIMVQLNRRIPRQERRSLVAYHVQNVLPGAAHPLELAILQACHEFGPHSSKPTALPAYVDLAVAAGWVIPFPRICFVSERPTRLCVDADGQLHAEDGPALSYLKGPTIFAWHGTGVPRDFILEPEWITPRTIRHQSDRLVRQLMIERFGLDKFLVTGGGRVVHEDDTGRLWSRRMGFGSLNRIVAVEVVNGTPEPDGTRRHYWLQVPPNMSTAREAVAWTYGLLDQEYKVEQRT